ncbi:MAG: hypothetical protein VB032_09995 [Burkholderiaceae bacterium]|nr:hypothetical protein [Burkholderiaceae bacterium]
MPKDLPEYITVDLGQVEANQIVHLSDLVLPEGVSTTAVDKKQAVATAAKIK